MAIHTISLKQLRPKLAEAIKKVDELYTRYLITKRGEIKAVLLSSDEMASLLETLEILSDSKLVESLTRAQREFKKRKGKPLQELRKELNVRS